MPSTLLFTLKVMKSLFLWKQAEGEVECTVKLSVIKLIDELTNSGGLNEFQKSISTKDPNTRCVTIPRSFYGRLKSCNKQVCPIVIYCRLWRWSDLENHHEVRAIESCEFAFNLETDKVCVNPYHYLRLETPTLLPIDVPENIGDAPSQLLPLDDYNSFFPDAEWLCKLENLNFPPTDILPTDNMSKNEDSQEQYGSEIKDAVFISSSGPFQRHRSGYLTEPKVWCSISYYELKDQVGEIFHASQPSVIVDGYLDPCNPKRFCLGLLYKENRNSVIKRTREHIQDGVQLGSNGREVFATCLSSSSLFVHSPNYNQRHGRCPETVKKMTRGDQLMIFSNQHFLDLLAETESQGFEAVYYLTRMTTIRMSFVKGWGAEYPHRETVDSTPCWIELRLNRPRKKLDGVLRKMKPSREMDNGSE